MFLLVVIAALAVGWLMDRFRQETIIKREEHLVELLQSQLNQVTDGVKMQAEEVSELFKVLPLEQFRSVTLPIQEKYRQKQMLSEKPASP